MHRTVTLRLGVPLSKTYSVVATLKNVKVEDVSESTANLRARSRTCRRTMPSSKK